MEIRQYERFEISFTGPSGGNPFCEVELHAEFRLGGRVVRVRGFYDGDGDYRVRFMPDALGTWSFTTTSPTAELDGRSGSFECVPGESHGPVRAIGTHFEYDDGEPYVPVGTTCYAWIHQPEPLRDQTIEALRKSPFTKIRMCLFPKRYAYNENEPESFVFPGSLSQGFDYTSFNPAFFAKLDGELDRLLELGIEADLILFHPYDHWGFKQMDPEVENRYLEYVVARYAAYRNVWWSMANEWDFMREKTAADFHRYFRIVQAEDHAAHLRSVHNGNDFYDHGLPWVTHLSIQRWETQQTSTWLGQYGKPVVIDECGYEGNIQEAWGSISGQELLRRQWTAVTHGGWPGAHGETYYNDREELWWAKGGMLTGESPPRIAFLRSILESAPVNQLSFEKARWDQPQIHSGEEYYLFYLGSSQASWRVWQFPQGQKYVVDVIDTWQMTVERLPGTFAGEARIPLPGREFVAIRATAVAD